MSIAPDDRPDDPDAGGRMESAAIAADRPDYRVPWTFWLWLAVIAAAYLVPRLLAPVPAASTAAPPAGGGVTATAFERTAQAEISTRLLFSPFARQAGMGGMAGDVLSAYRRLARDTGSPAMARRALIVSGAHGEKGRAGAALFELLETNLRARKVAAPEIAAEMALWRSVYGVLPPVRGPAEAERAAGRVRGLRIGFLEDRALQDLYARAGDQARADESRRRLEAAASRKTTQLALVAGTVFLAGVTGVVLLIVFAVSASQGNWPAVGRVETRPQWLSWGDLLDSFAFYLALVRGVGLAAALTGIRDSGAAPSGNPLVPTTLVYVGTGVGALFYLWAKARRRGVTLADIGLRAPGGVLANVAYGLAGYCAALPLVYGVAFLVRLVFKGGLGGPTTTPNPILPMLAGEGDPGGRLLIFLLVAAAAPILEELFFRGALFTGLRVRYTWIFAAAASAALFAVVHPINDWPQIFVLGFALATMREMRQSLIPGMVAHFCQNAMAFTMMSVIFSP